MICKESKFIDIDYESVEDVISTLQEFPPKAMLKFVYGDYFLEAYVDWEREETPEEEAERDRIAKANEVYIKERELKELARLKAKYED